MTTSSLAKRLAIIEARVNADVEARGPDLLSPLARSQLRDWQAVTNPEQQYEAMLDGTHPLSHLVRNNGISADASDVQAAEYCADLIEKMRNRKWNTGLKH